MSQTPQPNTDTQETPKRTPGAASVPASSKLEAALDAARRGFSVFPLKHYVSPTENTKEARKRAIDEAKKPVDGFVRWQYRATSDEAQIRQWWTRWPHANIAGVTEGRLVVDVDPKNGGNATYAILSLIDGFPNTLRTKTPSGGSHHIYALPDRVHVGGSVGEIGIGIDIRASGNYIVLPGSSYEGRPYEWANDAPYALAPQWLIAACKKPKPKSANAGKRVVEEDDISIELAKKYLTDRAPEANEGTRNNTAVVVANGFYDYGVSKETCVELLWQWNETHCFPPLGDPGELEQVAASAPGSRIKPIGSSHPLAPGFTDESEDMKPLTPAQQERQEIWKAELEREAQDAGPSVVLFPATPYTLTATPFVWRDPATIPRRQFLYGTHYIRQFVSSTIAPGGVGKSSLVLIEGLAMATGRALLGVQPEKRLRVWYWNGEDPKVETERRIAAACINYGIAPAELDGWLFTDSGRDAKIVIADTAKDGTKIARPVVDAVIATLRKNEIDVMTVDPFVSCHHVPENDNNGMDVVVKEWGGIADAANSAIELVHHSRKTNGAEVTVEDGRGASAVVFATRDARAINTMTKQEADNAGVVNRRLHFRCESGKANLAPPPDKADWFQLKSIPLGNGDGDMPDNGDKVAVVTSWQYPNMLAGVTSDLTAAALAKIRAGKYRSDSQATEWAGKVVAEVMGFDLGKTHEKAKTRNLIKLWLDNGALAKVKRKDKNGDERSFVEVARDE